MSWEGWSEVGRWENGEVAQSERWKRNEVEIWEMWDGSEQRRWDEFKDKIHFYCSSEGKCKQESTAGI